ncbi:MAG: undecaprenyl-diphosphate phosphatase [Candidatus Obscuribacterales bacterium]|jgi:undecaprenyl-diphosphatase|nr:undecaprenyl-diphosphate phosphatase [Candidatus Obscuribacterales bacterium]
MAMAGNSVSILEAVVLGIVQGASEFLPISSTAHLRVVPAFLHWQDPGVAYSAVIQLGSVIAVLTYFFKDLLGIATGAFKAIQEKDYASKDFRMAGAIIVGTIPICVLGLLLKPVLESDTSPLRALPVIGGASIFMGLLLLLAEKLAKRTRSIEDVSGKDGFLVGLGQAMALIPGCSRSGSTLTIALFLNYKREEAARFSFLLGIPAIVLSGLLELKHMVEHGLSNEGITSLLVGLLVSTAVSYAAIWWMLKFLGTHSTWVFVIYRLVFGAAVIALSLSGVIQ